MVPNASIDSRELLPLLQEGLDAAAAIGNPIARARHRSAWAYRYSVAEPRQALALAADVADPDDRADLLLTVALDRGAAGESLEPYFAGALEALDAGDAEAAVSPNVRLRVINGLSELAIQSASDNREAALGLLGRLVPALPGLLLPDSEVQQYHTLGCALLGEALWMLDDPRGRHLLAQAEEGAAALPTPEPVLGFLIGALAEREPEHALTLLPRIQDGPSRIDGALTLFRVLPEGDAREQVYQAAVEGARQIAHWQGPEHLVSLAQAVAAAAADDRARLLFDEALESARGNPAQMRALQITGVATAVAPRDRAWAQDLFNEAVAAAGAEEDAVKCAATLVLVANEMAEPFPREAADVFARAMRAGEALEAMWELAHLMDLVFRADRSPALDLSPARPLLERMLSLISDEDPRIPGVLGLADVARAMREIQPDRAVELYWRWFAAGEAAGDTDSMTAAALALHQMDEPAGREALGITRDFLIQRKDCPAMGEYSRSAAPLTPEFVLDLAPHIPDRRERAEARMQAALGLEARDPHAALQLLRELPPADRSLALLRIADRRLGLSDRPEPQPLLEDLP